MLLSTEERQRLGLCLPGVRMYKGKKTLYYNGEKLYDRRSETYLMYTYQERQTWECVVILHGVSVIPAYTFFACTKLTQVYMRNTVLFIKRKAFGYCEQLHHIRLSQRLATIYDFAFYNCKSLDAIFIPPSCGEIKYGAFSFCPKLDIFIIHLDCRLGGKVLHETALLRLFESIKHRELVFPFLLSQGISLQSREPWNLPSPEYQPLEFEYWVKSVNGGRTLDDKCSLHRICCSQSEDEDFVNGTILEILQRQGIGAFQRKNEIGITPELYHWENPERKNNQMYLIRRYITTMMGETVNYDREQLDVEDSSVESDDEILYSEQSDEESSSFDSDDEDEGTDSNEERISDVEPDEEEAPIARDDEDEEMGAY